MTLPDRLRAHQAWALTLFVSVVLGAITVGFVGALAVDLWSALFAPDQLPERSAEKMTLLGLNSTFSITICPPGFEVYRRSLRWPTICARRV